MLKNVCLRAEIAVPDYTAATALNQLTINFHIAPNCSGFCCFVQDKVSLALCYTGCMQAILLILSALLAIIGSTIYMVSIARGRTKPHRTTRFVLLIVVALNFVSVLAAGGNPGAALYAGIVCFFALAYSVMSIGRGMGGSSVFDWVCLILSLIGIVAWQVTDQPVLGIYFAVTADFIAYLPAFVKTWRHPNTESPWLYICSFGATLVGLAAYNIGHDSAFQAFGLVCCIAMLICIYHRKIRRVQALLR